MGLKKFEKNKSSNSIQIGNVPIDWDVKKLKYCLDINEGGIWTDLDDEGYYALRSTEINLDGTWNEKEPARIKISQGEYKRNKILENDLLVVKSSGSLQHIGKTAIASKQIEEKLCVPSNFMQKLRVNKLCLPKYIYYVLNSTVGKDQIGFLSSTTTGLRNITKGTLDNINVPLPTKSEQNSIVNFLDLKCDEIEEVILTKKKQIETLQDYKHSIITEAVTRGLDQQIKTKDSGVDWIGEVPKHWEVKKVKYKFFIKKKIKNEKEPTVLSLTQKGLKVKDLNNNEGQHAADYSKYQEVKLQDFVMNSMDLLTGFVDCSPFEGVTSPDYRVFVQRNDTECHQFYLYYFQICYWSKIFYGHGQGVSNFGRWRLQTDVFKEFPIPIPPTTEQIKIAEYLEEKNKQIDASILKITEFIKSLKNYRQSLIYEAVTGKIDVRNYKESEMEVKL
jgi:type I restriction enzyme, S subunit